MKKFLFLTLAFIITVTGCYHGDPGYGLCTPDDPGCNSSPGGAGGNQRKVVRAGGLFATYPINLASTAQVANTLGVGNSTPASVSISALNIDWSAGTVFFKTLAGGANTFTFSNQLDGQTIVVFLTGSASTVTWPTVNWSGGTAPTQTASGVDGYTFVDRGGTIYGSVVQDLR